MILYMVFINLNKKLIHWTNHGKMKMMFYGLSESRIKRILRSPKRIEEGVAPETVAMMQPAGTLKNPYEIWVMMEDTKNQRKIISAWKYPGKTKPKDSATLNFMRSEYDEYSS